MCPRAPTGMGGVGRLPERQTEHGEDGPVETPRPGESPTSFLLSAEELSSLETNSLLLKLSLMFLAGDLVEDKDLEAAPFFSTFPFICFSCFFFFFLDLSLRVCWEGGRERRSVTLLTAHRPCLWHHRAKDALHTAPSPGEAQAP